MFPSSSPYNYIRWCRITSSPSHLPPAYCKYYPVLAGTKTMIYRKRLLFTSHSAKRSHTEVFISYASLGTFLAVSEILENLLWCNQIIWHRFSQFCTGSFSHLNAPAHLKCISFPIFLFSTFSFTACIHVFADEKLALQTTLFSLSEDLFCSCSVSPSFLCPVLILCLLSASSRSRPACLPACLCLKFSLLTPLSSPLLCFRNLK